MPVVVVDEGEGVVVVFGGEAEGVFGDKVAVVTRVAEEVRVTAPKGA